MGGKYWALFDTLGFDAVKLIARAGIERRPVRLDLAVYPHLPKLMVQTTRAADYETCARKG